MLWRRDLRREMLRRYELSNREWEKIKFYLPGKEGDVGRTAKDNRLFVNAVLWVLRSGCPWADIPEYYGKYKSVHKRYSRWCQRGVWERVLAKDKKDQSRLMLDSTIVKAYSQAATYQKKIKDRKVSRRIE